jgi:hypothetical protein
MPVPEHPARGLFAKLVEALTGQESQPAAESRPFEPVAGGPSLEPVAPVDTLTVTGEFETAPQPALVASYATLAAMIAPAASAVAPAVPESSPAPIVKPRSTVVRMRRPAAVNPPAAHTAIQPRAAIEAAPLLPPHLARAPAEPLSLQP